MSGTIETADRAELSEKLKEFLQAHRIHLTAGQQRYLHIKRVTDAVLSGLALLVLLIPLGVVVILQKLSSPCEPAIFRQQRVGRGGKLFTMYKFRTMKTSAPQYASTKEFANAEQYISKLGHILRSTSIDELPQLYNVLRGDMSLIGPRPLIPQEDEVHYAGRKSAKMEAKTEKEKTTIERMWRALLYCSRRSGKSALKI